MAAFAFFNAGTQAAILSAGALAKRFFATYQRSIVAVGGVTTQRIEGGSQMYKKNTSAKFAFKAVDVDGNGVTGLTITAKTGKDGTGPTTASNAVVESGSGWYYITLTATEMNGDLIVLDPTASGATIAPITISTESDYTAARAAYIDAAVTSRMATYAQPTGFLAAAFPSDPADESLIIAATDAIMTRIGAPSGASVSADIASISLATNAGDMATKQADSSSLVTGSNTSGSVSNTATDDDVFWVTAPVSPAVGGFGLRQRLVFDLPLGRTPVNIQIRGYFQGSSNTAEVYALNSRTGAYDQLTNSRTDMASRSTESTYSIPLPRDYADDSAGSFNIVTLEFRSTSTNSTHRLRLDQVLITHVAEAAATTFTAPTAEQIWSYVTRDLTTPGAEPVTVPTATQNATAVRTELGTELGRIDVATSTRLASGTVASDVTAVKAKTDNLPTDPADASDIAGAFSTVNSTLGTIAGYIDTEVGAIKAKTDLIPASPAAVSDIPSASTVASAVRTNLATELGRIDVAVSSVGNSAPSASAIADEVQTRTLNANIQKVNGIAINGTGAPGDTWGP